MLDLTLDGFIEEGETKTDGSIWERWLALKITDNESSRSVAEWFYVVATSEQGSVELLSENSRATPASVLIQATFNEEELQQFAHDKFAKLIFNNWPDFYEKMSQEFTYSD
jgi:hypothetical protein